MGRGGSGRHKSDFYSRQFQKFWQRGRPKEFFFARSLHDRPRQPKTLVPAGKEPRLCSFSIHLKALLARPPVLAQMALSKKSKLRSSRQTAPSSEESPKISGVRTTGAPGRRPDKARGLRGRRFQLTETPNRAFLCFRKLGKRPSSTPLSFQ